MTSDDVTEIVESALRTGQPADDVRAALVRPYLQQFLLADSFQQMSAPAKSIVRYWVVAATSMYLEFFDPASGEFGLAEPVVGDRVPHTVGVRGDLVSTFRAM